MRIAMESTADVVLIEGVPCRKWNVREINGHVCDRSFLYSRLITADPDIDLSDDHVVLLANHEPPGAAVYPQAEELC